MDTQEQSTHATGMMGFLGRLLFDLFVWFNLARVRGWRLSPSPI
jgi:hypothetical protein